MSDYSKANKHTISFYNKFSFFYPFIDVFLRPQKRILFNEINKLPYGNVLEIGVGNGSNLSFYKKHDITGIDTSQKMLDAAKKIAGEKAVLLLMNGELLGFQDHSFDYVVLSHVLAVAGNPESILEEAYRVLKPRGRIFILNHFTPDNWLKYLDYSFQPVSKAFRFRSLFYLHRLETLKKFILLSETRVGALSYFKLLIYRKA
ncbi:MAG: class I SAM-dependent methyltransferase [Agriterribacter sp.]